MIYTPNFGGSFKNRTVLGPGGRAQDVVCLIMEQSETVVRGPTADGGINNKNIAIAFQLRPFADGHCHPLPWLVGSSDQQACPGNGHRVRHRRDMNVLLAITFSGPPGP